MYLLTERLPYESNTVIDYIRNMYLAGLRKVEILGYAGMHSCIQLKNFL